MYQGRGGVCPKAVMEVAVHPVPPEPRDTGPALSAPLSPAAPSVPSEVKKPLLIPIVPLPKIEGCCMSQSSGGVSSAPALDAIFPKPRVETQIFETAKLVPSSPLVVSVPDLAPRVPPASLPLGVKKPLVIPLVPLPQIEATAVPTPSPQSAPPPVPPVVKKRFVLPLVPLPQVTGSIETNMKE